jgi:polyhydroxyalkanoate synthesis regulator phasin
VGETDLLRRLLDAGAAFTDMSMSRAEAIVQELVRAGEVSIDQAQASVQELVERSRENTDKLVAVVRGELASQLGLATGRELADVERRLAALEAGRVAGTPAKAASAKKAPVKKAPVKKAPTKKASATKASAKKAAERGGT